MGWRLAGSRVLNDPIARANGARYTPRAMFHHHNDPFPRSSTAFHLGVALLCALTLLAPFPGLAAPPDLEEEEDPADRPAATIGRITLSGPLPAWANRETCLKVTIDGGDPIKVPVTAGTVSWTSAALPKGPHSVTVWMDLANVHTTFPSVEVGDRQVTPIPLDGLAQPQGTLVVELEYTGVPRNKLASTFDVTIDGALAPQKGTLRSSEDTHATTMHRTYRFEARISCGLHEVALTICTPQGTCRTKRLARVMIGRGQTTKIVHTWSGNNLLSRQGGVRNFDAPCDCDGKTFAPPKPVTTRAR